MTDIPPERLASTGTISRKRLFLFSLVGLTLLLVITEVFVRLLFVIPVTSKYLRTNDDLSWRRMWEKRHRQGIEIFYRFDIYDSTLGWISRPMLRNKFVFNNKVLNTNSKGLRGRREFSLVKDPSKKRILVVGDSFTFGDEVSDDETFPSILQEMLPNSEVINMGVHGYGHDQMLILMEEVGLKYKPDIVVLGFVYMDMGRNMLQFRDFAKPRYLIRNGRLHLVGVPVPRPEQVLRWKWTRPRTFDFISILRRRFARISGRYDQDKKSLTMRILDKMVRDSKKVGAVPIFIYLPYGRGLREPAISDREEAFLFKYGAKNKDVTCISSLPSFRKKMREGTVFKTSNHWLEPGHRTVAECIRDYLIENKLVDR